MIIKGSYREKQRSVARNVNNEVRKRIRKFFSSLRKKGVFAKMQMTECAYRSFRYNAVWNSDKKILYCVELKSEQSYRSHNTIYASRTTELKKVKIHYILEYGTYNVKKEEKKAFIELLENMIKDCGLYGYVDKNGIGEKIHIEGINEEALVKIAFEKL